ncbi:uncharacterized protein RCC_09851 [Ramularia collo-cygni]|uniref:Azaphilone pigments biosynthesis cluster protein L N-terminal domain-containing protein n=1 Tax=Ramularia collo-cygni TaxID=112498 RepID=A0A2D3VMU4_9PEZI|nr:uncharacterized protein RCC_09851 [Ramularia collo-cygni]CZT24134.1 uncharacterized protein RCC_09851 [Ramularia collo-cygni]
MADPFSIAVGVVGIVVPALHALRVDLHSAVLALESLKAIPEPEWHSLGLALAEQLKDAVKTCGSACDNFRNDLQRWTRRSRDGDLSWRDRANVGFFKERQIRAMSEHLQSCKLACSSVAGMGTLYSSLRTGHMTEELKNTIATSRTDLDVVARRSDGEIAQVSQSLTELTVTDTSLASDDEEDDRISAEAQLSEQKVALEVCQALFARLQSMLQDEKIEKLGARAEGTTNVSFASITGGFGIGVSHAPISNVTFGSPHTNGSASS